jgi:hypothetical protein
MKVTRMTRDPPTAKRQSLDRDRRAVAEYPQQFRHAWPRKEALATRSWRSGVKQALQIKDPEQAEDQATAHRRTQVRKWTRTSMTLRERIAQQHQRRGRLGMIPCPS